MDTIIQNAEIIVTNDGKFHYHCDILISGNKIKKIGPNLVENCPDCQYFDATGLTILPGFIQTHVHLCQTAFRNTADDVELMDWLAGYIWPGEAGLSFEQLYHSALCGLEELLLGGTTTILDMATIRHTDAVFKAMEVSGIRGFSGKVLMDDSQICPPSLCESTENALRETEELIERWHGREGRLFYAPAPRFAVSCTESLLTDIIKIAEKKSLLLHSHASENRGEIEIVRNKTGRGNIEYFHDIGFLGANACIAHCIHLEDGDMERLKSSNTRVLHCPGSNLKLASGIARVPEMLEQGICVSLGADGPPCNNLLDMFREMYLASVIQKPINGPTSMPAKTVFEMATIQGAKALGLENEIGRIKEGMKADLIMLDLKNAHNGFENRKIPENGYTKIEDNHTDAAQIYSTIVYASKSTDVRHVMVDGKIVVEDSSPCTI